MRTDGINYQDIINPIMIAYQDGMLRESITCSSTATNCIHVIPTHTPPSGYPSFTIFVNSPSQLKNELWGYLDDGYDFDIEDVTITCSIHQNRLRDARKDLLNLLGSTHRSVYEIQKIITTLGVALNVQIDKNPSIFENTTVANNIYYKLRHLGLDCDDVNLFKKYSHLNQFYNATKHLKDQKYRQLEDRMNRPDGFLIAIDFFETVRRIFTWYYSKFTGSIPQWEELQDIDYSHYKITYLFQYNHTWV